jgi:hypothetical protein
VPLWKKSSFFLPIFLTETLTTLPDFGVSLTSTRAGGSCFVVGFADITIARLVTAKNAKNLILEEYISIDELRMRQSLSLGENASTSLGNMNILVKNYIQSTDLICR